MGRRVSKTAFLKLVEEEFERAENMRGGEGHPDNQHLGREVTNAVRKAVMKALQHPWSLNPSLMAKAIELANDFDAEDRFTAERED